MTMTRDVPWALVGRLQSEIDPQFGPHSSTASQAGSWLPPTDIQKNRISACCTWIFRESIRKPWK